MYRVYIKISRWVWSSHLWAIWNIQDFKMAAIWYLFSSIFLLLYQIETSNWCLYPHFQGQGIHLWYFLNRQMVAILDFNMAAIRFIIYSIYLLLYQIVRQNQRWTWICDIKFIFSLIWLDMGLYFKKQAGAETAPLMVLRNSRWIPRWPPKSKMVIT